MTGPRPGPVACGGCLNAAMPRRDDGVFATSLTHELTYVTSYGSLCDFHKKFIEHEAPESVRSYSDESLLLRVMANLRQSPEREPQPRWVLVMKTFGLGSTFSQQLCERFGMDPDEEI